MWSHNNIIAFWYQTQPMCFKWGKFNSKYFKFQMVYAKVGCYRSNSLLYILMVYLKILLCLAPSGCNINEQCMNHVMYENDIYLLASSAIGLQRMLDVCFNFSIIVPLKQILPNSFFGCFELGIISESKFYGASTCGIAEVKRYLQIV